MVEVFKIVKQKYDTTIVHEISVNSSSLTRGNTYKLLNQTFSTTYGIYTEDTPPPACMRDPACNRGLASISTSESDPRPVCGARRLSGARLLSVQVNQTPGLYAGPGVYPGPGFYPTFYGIYLTSLNVFRGNITRFVRNGG